MEKNAEINTTAIGERIRQEREKLGLSREDFAAIIELSNYYVGQLERGERQMSLPALVKVAGCLHVTLDYLIFGGSRLNDYYANDSRDTYTFATKDSEVNKLLEKCSPQELELFKKIIKAILPYL